MGKFIDSFFTSTVKSCVAGAFSALAGNSAITDIVSFYNTKVAIFNTYLAAHPDAINEAHAYADKIATNLTFRTPSDFVLALASPIASGVCGALAVKYAVMAGREKSQLTPKIEK